MEIITRTTLGLRACGSLIEKTLDVGALNDAVIAIYKPKGPTSHDVIYSLRRLTGIRRIGHAGTLDPLADGVLIVGIGKGTSKLFELTGGSKEYLAEVTLGMTSATDDSEGPFHVPAWSGSDNGNGISKNNVNNDSAFASPSLNEVQNVLQKFVGNILQVPPALSALKINGTPAYKHFRKGKPVEMKPRPVVIYSISLESYAYPVLKIKVKTGPGVYIRSLARDIGESLKLGGYLSSLTRTEACGVKIEDAIKLEEIKIK